MTVQYNTIPNAYQDSVKLMRVASEIADSFGVDEAVAVMGTAENKRLLVDMDLVGESDLDAVDSNDLILVVSGSDAETVEQALVEMRDEIRGQQDPREGTDTSGEQQPRSLYTALDRRPDANLALVSVPGEYAAREAWKALHEGLHVHVFSDGVPLEDERELKSAAREKDRLVMGPDCGSAIINGVPLGFANAVRDGSIGVVSAAGTGLQEVTSLVDRAGAGISHAIGTGGRDLRDDVGGITMQQGLGMLARDEQTDVILLVSKPPGAETMEDVLAAVRDCSKPVVVAFVGSDPEAIASTGATPAESLKDGARQAIRALNGADTEVAFDDGLTALTDPERAGDIVSERGAPDSSRQYVRGLYSGGTLCHEAITWLRDHLDQLSSNLDEGARVDDPMAPAGDACIDLGADELTRGRPHPMIDTSLRDEQLRRALDSDDVMVVLLDVVLGYNAHPDPGGAVTDVVAESGNDWPVVVASVCGTRADPQAWDEQVAELVDAGVYVCESNVDAVRLTAQLRDEAATTGGESS